MKMYQYFHSRLNNINIKMTAYEMIEYEMIAAGK